MVANVVRCSTIVGGTVAFPRHRLIPSACLCLCFHWLSDNYLHRLSGKNATSSSNSRVLASGGAVMRRQEAVRTTVPEAKVVIMLGFMGSVLNLISLPKKH